MEKLETLYGKEMAEKIEETYASCKDDHQLCSKAIDKFKHAGVLPRGLLYKSLIEKNDDLSNTIERQFQKEIGQAFLRYVTLGTIEVGKKEIDDELKVWHEIWRERERERERERL